MLNIFFELGKIRITSFVAISASVGYILAASEIKLEMLWVVLGVFLLSCGSSAFNQVQEHLHDAKMNRTKRRPLPSGSMTYNSAVLASSGMVLSGLSILYFGAGLNSFLLGIFAVFWYNIFYTPLKRVTSLAVVPGALVGAIPPLIGWVAGGGWLFSPLIWVFAIFIFIWQIPHFWLLLMVYEDDYRSAGFPVLTDMFSSGQLTRITFAWIVALAVSCLLLPLFGVTHNPATLVLLIMAGSWLLWRTKNLVGKYDKDINFLFAFKTVNIYVLTVVVLLSVDRLINM